MPDLRVHNSVAERIDVDVDRVPKPWHRARRIATCLATIVPLVWLALAAAWQDRTIYEARPVTQPHRMFENECRNCHTEIAQPLVRLATLDDGARSVRDDACLHCHGGMAADHNATIIVGDVERCVDCHKEHLDRDQLLRVTDAHCALCHGELRTKEGSPSSFVAQIADFSEHPEFAVVSSDTQRPGPNHGVHLLASVVRSRWTDKAQIRFNHAIHLDSDGVPVPPTHPDFGDGETLKKLACADCHQPDDEGRYMRPINYERHCILCHKLEISTKLLGSNELEENNEEDDDERGPLPHVRLHLIRGILRERLMVYAESHPEEISQPAAAPPSRLPKRPAEPSPSAKDRWEWIEQQLSKLDDRIAGGSAGEPNRGIAQNCAYCHEVTREKKGSGGLARWKVSKPNIPSRWMPHSRFSHRRHASMRCVECHQTPGQAVAATLTSSKTGDVLMPRIEICRQCHGAAGGGHGERARSDCVECHGYHRHRGPFHGRAIGELLGETED
ncbi:MAG: hypothetical protein IIA67_13105 [Planctomycetes bacterium]|nr:hypothetical protein [Planctomycetota bacterium]